MNRNRSVQFLSKFELPPEHFNLCKIISLIPCNYGYEGYICIQEQATKTVNKFRFMRAP
jgi:hypothetical protein